MLGRKFKERFSKNTLYHSLAGTMASGTHVGGVPNLEHSAIGREEEIFRLLEGQGEDRKTTIVVLPAKGP